MMIEPTTTKAELLTAIEQNWATLTATLDRLSEAQLTTIHDAQGWTAKDHLIHLYYWERSIVYFLQGQARHTGLDVDEALYLAGDEDAINDAIFQKHKAIPLAAAKAQLEDMTQQLVSLLQPLSDADLQKPYRAYLPDEPGEGDGPLAINVVHSNSANHFAEHLAWLEALAAQHR
jgi:hypothetical protein